MGWLSAAIAHEIRNPVAMILCSLATTIRSPLSPNEQEGFDIAAKEADRCGTRRPISESVMPSIFEPFFTTRLSGTGLGLAIAHNIAPVRGGLLQLTSNSPATVRFTLTFPRSAISYESQESKKA